MCILCAIQILSERTMENPMNKEFEQTKNRLENETSVGNLIKDYGQITLTNNRFHHKIYNKDTTDFRSYGNNYWGFK